VTRDAKRGWYPRSRTFHVKKCRKTCMGL